MCEHLMIWLCEVEIEKRHFRDTITNSQQVAIKIIYDSKNRISSSNLLRCPVLKRSFEKQINQSRNCLTILYIIHCELASSQKQQNRKTKYYNAYW